MTESTAIVLPASDYRDRKRPAWLLSLFVPLLAAVGPCLYLLTGQLAMLWVPVAFNYLVIPAADYLMGTDRSNPPESAVPALEADPYYRYVTYALVPILWLVFIFSAWFVVSYELPWYGMLAMVFSTGGVGGFCINLGHELGHKRGKLEPWLSRIVLAVTGYGHFSIEHNRGHHRDVATPEDPASSRMGESIYRFVLREMPGALRRAWNLEKERLNRGGRSVWSYENEILQPLAITIVLWSALIAWLGIGVVPFLLLASFWANFQLTSANYVEHYGLLRQRLANGKLEMCQPHHSWNSNHIFSNWAVFHLQRHSDHHAHPARRYQSLRHFENLPQLPSGYFGMFPIAYVPPLWYRIMDPRLLEVTGRDPRRINFQPEQRARLMRRYELADSL